MSKLIIHTHHAPAAIGPYSQAVRAGDLLFVSGQIPIDPATGQLIEGSVAEQTHRLMSNIDAILTEGGFDFTNVVKTTIFLQSMDDFATVNEVYASYFNGNFPARETVEVSRLPKNARVEISVIASL